MILCTTSMNKLASLRCSYNGISAVISGLADLQRSNNGISAVISGLAPAAHTFSATEKIIISK
ncbi:hypothetical protein PRIO_4434 [Paenibacillus riograndensis SBR5]|uniref:Uncharacterized protein n=1 Tax=Paenibacillus riograndensis SBR5 TaxID=1073571 RepID=A0A0E4CXW1_9BACL|nr:hypothetical protein PRIO_4434 [Paenibacillus riograndensis SBR5]